MDRVVNLFHKVHRYECRSAGCGWEGGLETTHRRAAKGGRRMRTWMWLAVVAISVAAALVMVAYLDSRPSPATGAESAP